MDDTLVGRHYGKIDLERVGNGYPDKGTCLINLYKCSKCKKAF